jgi:TatD family-associated radical SAM protein
MNRNTPNEQEPFAPLVAYEYRPKGLYLNITNRCTNACLFCSLRACEGWLGPLNLNLAGVRGIPLRVHPHVPEIPHPVQGEPAGASFDMEYFLAFEPDPGAIIAELDALIGQREAPVDEVVFCGSGEPLIRLDTVLATARALKARDLKVRINTNGQAALIHGPETVSKLGTCVDAISISLNAQDRRVYSRLCRPAAGMQAHDAVLDFCEQSVRAIPEVWLTAVMPSRDDRGRAPLGLDVEACREIAKKMGAEFRLR